MPALCRLGDQAVELRADLIRASAQTVEGFGRGTIDAADAERGGGIIRSRKEFCNPSHACKL
jgi:hypothetical protein